MNLENQTIADLVLLHQYSSKKIEEAEQSIEDCGYKNPNANGYIEISNHWFKVAGECEIELDIRTEFYTREEADL